MTTYDAKRATAYRASFLSAFLAMGVALAGCQDGPRHTAPAPTPVDPSGIRKAQAAGIHDALHYGAVGEERMAVHPRDRVVEFDVTHYDLAVKADPVRGTIRGQVVVEFASTTEQLTTVSLDASQMTIQAVTTLADDALTYHYDGQLLTITLKKPLARGKESAVKVAYEAARPRGFHITGSDASDPDRMTAGYTFTQPEGSQSWYPCLDRPSDKATATITVDVPSSFNVLSNGTLTRHVQTASSETYSYRMEKPVATYLVSLAIGQYDIINLGRFKGKPLKLWAPPAIRDVAYRTTAPTARMMHVFSRFTGLDYPFASYSQSVAQAWRSSMEHQSATTLGGWRVNGDGSGESVVAHELAHQWFGDWVTCATWGELWLNEGFASFLPAVYFAALGRDDATFAQYDWWRSGYFNEAKTKVRPLSDPRPDIPNIFDSHSYEKGALVLKLMRHMANGQPSWLPSRYRLGDEPFSKALRAYLREHGQGNVTNSYLMAALEQETGRSWAQFFEQWVRSPGHPIVRASYTAPKDGELALTIEQTQHTGDRKWRLFSFPLEVELVDETGRVSYQTVSVYEEHQTFTLPTAARVVAINLDPNWVVPAEFEIEQNVESWQKVLTHSPSPLSRAEAVRAAGRMSDDTLPQAMVEAIAADASDFVKTSSFGVLTKHTTNRAAVETIIASLRDDSDSLDVNTVEVLAPTEAWLVEASGEKPSDAEVANWQTRYLTSRFVAERDALLRMMAFASVEAAQEFGLARLKEDRWVTRDRWAIVGLLSSHLTDKSRPFLETIMRDGLSEIYLGEALTNIANNEIDEPSLVSGLLKGARTNREDYLRSQFVLALGAQKSSQAEVCRELTTFEHSAALTNAAQSAAKKLGCP